MGNRLQELKAWNKKGEIWEIDLKGKSKETDFKNQKAG